jgi:hypothetical protein
MGRKLVISAAAASGIALAYWKVIRPWHRRWGATEAELIRELPGDEYVRHPLVDSTRAITIDAPVGEVWKWLQQIGQNRAGFYSYSWLENLLGCNMHNADRIVPEWQHIERGDEVWLHPKVKPLEVQDVIPGRSIILKDDWSFHVEPLDSQRTRLIVRSRGTYKRPDLKFPPLNWFYWQAIFEPAHFIMERGMMRGIKHRAERAHAASKEMLTAPVL